MALTLANIRAHFGDLPTGPRIFPNVKRHCFVILGPFANFPAQDFNFQCQDLDIFIPTLTVSAMKRKG